MEHWLTLSLFLLTANLDTLLLAMAWNLARQRLALWEGGVLALVTSAITGLALALGQRGGTLISPAVTGRLATLLLVAMGVWVILDWLRQLGEEEEAPAPGRGGLLGCLTLGAALGANNGGMGLVAGLAGIGPLEAALGNALVTLAALELGQLLGRRWLGRLLGRYTLPISGGLLILLGALVGN